MHFNPPHRGCILKEGWVGKIFAPSPVQKINKKHPTEQNSDTSKLTYTTSKLLQCLATEKYFSFTVISFHVFLKGLSASASTYCCCTSKNRQPTTFVGVRA